MKLSHVLLGLLSLILLASAEYARRLHKKKLQEYEEIGLRPFVDEVSLSNQVERCRKAVPLLLFLCPFPLVFIQQLVGLTPIAILLMKLSAGSIIVITLLCLKLMLKVPLGWFTSFPLTWKKQLLAFVLGLCAAWLFSSVYDLTSNPNMRTQAWETVLHKLGA